MPKIHFAKGSKCQDQNAEAIMLRQVDYSYRHVSTLPYVLDVDKLLKQLDPLVISLALIFFLSNQSRIHLLASMLDGQAICIKITLDCHVDGTCIPPSNNYSNSISHIRTEQN